MAKTRKPVSATTPAPQSNPAAASGAPAAPACNIAAALEPLRVAIDTLMLDPANVRQHPERSIEAIKGSLARFGQQKPIVIDAAGLVIAGNGTLEAARRLGWTHIAAARSGLAGVERAAFAIADNRTAELSEWDDEALQGVLGQLDPELAWAAGFSLDDMAKMLGEGDKLNPACDEVPEPAPFAATRPGDLWLLGDHRLLCGDSTNPAHVDRLMNGKLAALVATDPPYLVDYTGERPNNTGKDWSATYKEVQITDADGFFRGLFGNVLRVVAPRAAIYCWHAHKRQGLISRIWEDLGILDHQQVIWVKPTPVFGRVYWHFRHEPCMMGWVKGSQPEHDSDHSSNSVWEIDWEGKSRVVGNEHPTQKPVEIFARPMRKHTQRGDICFEPFSGSGSQLVAAEGLARRCYAMELEPVFVDVAVRRWQTLTGREAVLESSGQTWQQVYSERGGEATGSEKRRRGNAAAQRAAAGPH
jgi:DNA modification methylase